MADAALHRIHQQQGGTQALQRYPAFAKVAVGTQGVAVAQLAQLLNGGVVFQVIVLTALRAVFPGFGGAAIEVKFVTQGDVVVADRAEPGAALGTGFANDVQAHPRIVGAARYGGAAAGVVAGHAPVLEHPGQWHRFRCCGLGQGG
ncbi:hypothetical protein D3C75_963150 [compost metagenome]